MDQPQSPIYIKFILNEQGRSQIPDSPAKPPTHRGSVSNNTPNSTLLQTDAAWREDLHLAGLGWIVGEGIEKVSILAHCHYVNSPPGGRGPGAMGSTAILY
ncbi:unnamed protein product [Brassica rapa subsp. trilocularis]